MRHRKDWKTFRLWLGMRVNPGTGGERVVLIEPASDREIGDDTAANRAPIEAEARIRELEDQAQRLRGRKRR